MICTGHLQTTNFQIYFDSLHFRPPYRTYKQQLSDFS